MQQEKTYTKEEVRELLEPLLKQIEFLIYQYQKCQEYILLPWYRRLNPYKFIRSLWKEEDESGTIIYQFLDYYQKHPTEFQFLKDWYDKRSPNKN